MSDTCDQLKTVVHLGSDLLPPFTTMEAKMVNTLHTHLKDNYRFRLISINVSRDTATVAPSATGINGWRRGPMILRKFSFGIQLLRVYTNLLLSRRVDIIHMIWVGFDPLTSFMIRMAKKKRAQVIVTVLNTFAPFSRYRLADCLVFHSQHSKNRFLVGHPEALRSVVIPPPVHLKTRPRRKSSTFVFVSGPRTKAQIRSRGVPLMLDAMRILQNRGSDIRLEFIGRWPEGAGILENMMQERALTNVNMSHEYRPDVNELVAGAAGLLIPYVGDRTGDVPLSALESLAMGTPVITTLGFHIRREDERPAVTFCEPDPRRLAEAMRATVENGDISDQCRAAVRDCRVDNFVASYKELYDGWKA